MTSVTAFQRFYILDIRGCNKTIPMDDMKNDNLVLWLVLVDFLDFLFLFFYLSKDGHTSQSYSSSFDCWLIHI